MSKKHVVHTLIYTGIVLAAIALTWLTVLYIQGYWEQELDTVSAEQPAVTPEAPLPDLELPTRESTGSSTAPAQGDSTGTPTEEPPAAEEEVDLTLNTVNGVVSEVADGHITVVLSTAQANGTPVRISTVELTVFSSNVLGPNGIFSTAERNLDELQIGDSVIVYLATAVELSSEIGVAESLEQFE